MDVVLVQRCKWPNSSCGATPGGAIKPFMEESNIKVSKPTV